MKIIISHVFSNDNKGDAALLSVLLDDIKHTFSNSEITILTIDKIKENEMFEGVPVANAFMYDALNRYQYRAFKLPYSLFVMGITLLWAYVYRLTCKKIWLPNRLRKVASLYQSADLIIPVGGGYLRGKPGIVSTVLLMLTLHPLIFARILGKPTICYSQSIGPFGNKLQIALAGFALRKVDCIIARENVTVRLLRSIGVSNNVVRGIDSGFLFKGNGKINLREMLKIPKEKIIVGITVRKWLNKKGQSRYENAISKFADYIIKKYHVAVIFIPQVTALHHNDDDRKPAKRIATMIFCKEDVYVLKDNYDHRNIKDIYGSLDYLIGTRFHSVIFALTDYVPVIAIEYEHKTSGIMKDLGFEKWVVPMEEVKCENLATLFDQLIKERNEYVAKLKEKLPVYLEEAKKTREILKKFSNRL